MAKRKKASKVLKRKLRRGNSAKRGKPRRMSKAAKAAKRMAGGAKPKPGPVKKAARKRRVQSVAPAIEAIEAIAVEVIEQPAPGVITVEETEVRPGSE